MNTHVPGEQTTEGFYEVLGVMLVVLIGMVVLFRKRGWL